MMRGTTAVLTGAVLGVAGLGGAAHAQQVNVELLYNTTYQQTSVNPPTLEYQNDGYAFVSALGDPIYNLDLMLPTNQTSSFDELGGGFYQSYIWVDGSRTGLMANVPDGEYVFSWEDEWGNEYSSVLVQPYPAGLWPAQTPAFTPASYTALQGMDPSQTLTVTVNQFMPNNAANTRLGGMYININDDGGYGPLVYSDLRTGPSATLTTREIPAGTLQPGTSYFVSWLFAHDVNSPGHTGPGLARSQFRVTTRVPFTTAGTQPPVCPDVDFNQDGGLDVADIAAFFDAFTGNDPAPLLDPDVNQDGGIDVADIDLFFTAFAGGPC